MWKFVKRVMGQVDPIDLAKAELKEAQFALLEAQTGADFANALILYNSKRIERLRNFIGTSGK